MPALVVAILLLAVPAAPSGDPRYLEDFEFIVSTVARKGAAVRSKKIDWPAESARLKPLFARCTSDEEHVTVQVPPWGPGGKGFSLFDATVPDGVEWREGAVSKLLSLPWCAKVGYLRITGSTHRRLGDHPQRIPVPLGHRRFPPRRERPPHSHPRRPHRGHGLAPGRARSLRSRVSVIFPCRRQPRPV